MNDNSFANIAKVQLLAKIAMLEGKPDSFVETNAKTLIDMLDSSNPSALKQLLSEIIRSNKKIEIPDLIPILAEIPSTEKCEIVRSCCYLATCRGELSHISQGVLLDIGRQLGLEEQDILMALSSVN